jgi:hypothetical protein
MSKLDDLFDQACEYLSDLPNTEYQPQFIEMSFEIIDRWLQVRREDREYETARNARMEGVLDD